MRETQSGALQQRSRGWEERQQQRTGAGTRHIAIAEGSGGSQHGWSGTPKPPSEAPGPGVSR